MNIRNKVVVYEVFKRIGDSIKSLVYFYELEQANEFLKVLKDIGTLNVGIKRVKANTISEYLLPKNTIL
jgi:translation initiation factor 6 (eIF-6)